MNRVLAIMTASRGQKPITRATWVPLFAAFHPHHLFIAVAVRCYRMIVTWMVLVAMTGFISLLVQTVMPPATTTTLRIAIGITTVTTTALRCLTARAIRAIALAVFQRPVKA